MSYVIANKEMLILFALALSEALALLPMFKANGILDGAIKLLKFLKEKLLAPKL
jgi:hypothetical protein